MWLMGYDNSPGVNGGGTLIDFNTYPPTITYELRAEDFYVANTSLCDQNGYLLFYSNGCAIFNRERDFMDMGDTISPGYLTAAWCDDEYAGTPFAEGVVALNFPGITYEYFLLNDSCKSMFLDSVAYDRSLALLLNRIRIDDEFPLGKVVEKGTALLRDTLVGGYMQAIRHANGRDWWVIVPEYFSNCYHILLLTPLGLQEHKKQCIGHTYGPIDGSCQATSSPDGTKYARFSGLYGLQLLDFDRCTGELSSPFWMDFSAPDFFRAGVAFSPDSRYLYASAHVKIFQLDLQAPDIAASKTLVAEWDGGLPNYPTRFYLEQLGPDGKIYVGSAGTHLTLHVIHFPNRPGLACAFEQRGLALASPNSWGMPAYPNYRLGPVDGSACDTLGLDNRPLANFRWDVEDTLAPLQVTFTDLSAYEPGEWFWDFGDGATSEDTSPMHAYMAEGIYTACLRVSNANAADTICRTVALGVSAAPEPDAVHLQVAVVPNPCRDRVVVQIAEYAPRNARWVLRDALGKLVTTHQVTAGLNEMALPSVQPGFYCWSLEESGRRIAAGRLICVD